MNCLICGHPTIDDKDYCCGEHEVELRNESRFYLAIKLEKMAESVMRFVEKEKKKDA